MGSSVGPAGFDDVCVTVIVENSTGPGNVCVSVTVKSSGGGVNVIVRVVTAVEARLCPRPGITMFLKPT